MAPYFAPSNRPGASGVSTSAIVATWISVAVTPTSVAHGLPESDCAFAGAVATAANATTTTTVRAIFPVRLMASPHSRYQNVSIPSVFCRGAQPVGASSTFSKIQQVHEREVLFTGVGGQGVQIVSKALAMAVVAEGREALLLPQYSGGMRGSKTNAKLTVGDAPLRALPIVIDAWSAFVMDQSFWETIRPKLRAGCGRGRQLQPVPPPG